MGTLDIVFKDGEELLGAYWGYLSGGGLILDDPGLELGTSISLHITIKASVFAIRLKAKVIKREPDSHKIVLAFNAGEAHDILLSQAMSDSENVAPRRYARFSVQRPVQVSAKGALQKVTLVNISQEGCCLKLGAQPGHALDVDADLIVQHGQIHALGKVVWSRYRERGVLMSLDESRPLLRELVPDSFL